MRRSHEAAAPSRVVRGFVCACGLAAALAAGRTVRAQDAVQPPSQPSFRASSSLVVLNTTVAEQDGRLVAGLPQDRFAVFDNDRPQPIALFSNEDMPVTVGLVVDASFSMRPKIGEVIGGASRFARVSNPDDEVFAIAFNERVRDPLEGHAFVHAGDVSALEQALEALVPDGETGLYDAMLAALDRLDTGSWPRKALVVLSDGGDNASAATLNDVLARARRSNAAIYTIGLFDADDRDRNPGVLKTLSEMTGGVRYLPASPGIVIQDCERIARDIRSGYTIGFEAPSADGAYHRLRVDIVNPRDAHMNVRTRAGYLAPIGARP